MTYQVLARKWRPHNFTEVVGQEHVVKPLTNALHHGRLHHAYLFTGTRGVGKTTLARILAKAINCENLQDFNPCGACDVCLSLDEGRFLDLIEVDAASRTKVDDTRELLDNVQYTPNQGRYKVYLIDEVHMLSTHSFNALLKTLEEPPPHVKFLLATTDPHKIPVTVLSRCLQFNLRRLQPAQIFARMELILKEEGIAGEPAALKVLARAADGSMRDGLSLLDQAIVYGSGKVALDDVNAMLGTVAQHPVNDLLTALADRDAAALFDKINDLADLTPDFGEILNQILLVLHRIALVQQIPGACDPDIDADMIAALTSKFSPEDVQLYYQIALIGQRDLDLAPDPRSGFEMTMLRMLTFRPATPDHSAVKQSDIRPAVKKTAPQETHNHQPTLTQQTPPLRNTDNPPGRSWTDMIAAMKLTGLTKELADNCILQSIDKGVCTLVLDSNREPLRIPRTEENLQKALQTYLGESVKLSIATEKTALATPAAQMTQERIDKQQAAVDAINADDNIQALKEQFDARIMPGTIEPV
ncbi:MAG: DNA polymerase III subunit gamma/tau [Gammaproteobacteria bacterium]